MRRQKPRTLPSKCAARGCPRPGGIDTAGPAPAPPGIGKTPPAGSPVPMERVSSPAIDRSDCCSRGGAAMRTSLRRIATAAVAVIAVGAATAALPGTAEARWHGWLARPRRLGRGWVRLGLRAWFRGRLRCALLRWVLWRPVLRLRGRLRHAPPLGDQPLGSSRLAVDSRLLLDVPFGWPPARRPAVLRVSLRASRDR